MAKTVLVLCKNNGQSLQVETGSTLADIYKQCGLQMEYGPISARVNNKVEGMHFRVYNPKEVEFLDIQSSSGLRAYTRTLFFVLCKAVHDLYKGNGVSVNISIPVSNGYYVDLQLPIEEGSTKPRPVLLEDVGRIRRRMQEIIDQAIPIHRHQTTTEEAIRMFSEEGASSKVKLLKSQGQLFTTYYDIDGYNDYYYWGASDEHQPTLPLRAGEVFRRAIATHTVGRASLGTGRDDPSKQDVRHLQGAP